MPSRIKTADTNINAAFIAKPIDSGNCKPDSEGGEQGLRQPPSGRPRPPVIENLCVEMQGHAWIPSYSLISRRVRQALSLSASGRLLP
jgi:hypothetical protein